MPRMNTFHPAIISALIKRGIPPDHPQFMRHAEELKKRRSEETKARDEAMRSKHQ